MFCFVDKKILFVSKNERGCWDAGVFSGLPPRPSRELRTQTSLDKVAYWQQTRQLSSSTFGDRLSQNLIGLMDEGLDGDPEHYGQVAADFGF